jgi:hypothetical protein
LSRDESINEAKKIVGGYEPFGAAMNPMAHEITDEFPRYREGMISRKRSA